MLTIYSTLKNFTNEHTRTIQTNAVKSWLQLTPTPEIFIMGGDESVKEFCKEVGVNHVEVAQSDYGVPYLNKMMLLAEKLASNDFLLLVSGDIILFQEVMLALKITSNRLYNFCICAIKQESNLSKSLNFEDDWEKQVKDSIVHYSLPTSGDFFLYCKKHFLNALPEIPEFIIGRSLCDSWLIKKSIEADILVDATEFITLVHQQHDHSHITLINGDSPEYQTNLKLADNSINTKINESNWVLGNDHRLIKNVNVPYTLNNIFINLKPD